MLSAKASLLNPDPGSYLIACTLLLHCERMLGVCALLWLVTAVHAAFHLLDPAAYEPYLYGDFEWATSNIPFFEASLDNLTAAYFFRWHTYRWAAASSPRSANRTSNDAPPCRQHIVHYPDSVGYVVTEFLVSSSDP